MNGKIHTIFKGPKNNKNSSSGALDIPSPDNHDKDVKKLDKLAKESARVILDIKAVFPFNFFPDEIIVDETKVSIHTNLFFLSSRQVRSVEFKDIFNVIVQQGVIFAKLEIVDRFFAQDPITIEFLKKKDANKARKIIQGMMLAKKESIDTSKLPKDELISKLERIGESR